jgi:hypothetical protein
MTTIETYRVFGLCAVLASGMVMLACSDNSPGAGSGGKGGSSGSSTGTNPTSGSSTTGGTTTTGGSGGSGSGGHAVTYCDPAKWGNGAPVEPQLITMDSCSDFDAEGSEIGIHCIMPGGVWQVDTDGMGTPKADSMTVANCGTTGNGMHFIGMGHSGWGADVAAAIVSQAQPVDVSGYTGMSFVMKAAAATNLIFKVQNPYSQPPCGKCDETVPPVVAGTDCYSGYTKNVPIAANSTAPITVSWADLTQQGWGYRAPGTAMFDVYNLVSVAFAFDTNINFDVCIDDVKFVK